MSLAPSEREALARIEDALRSSDPALAAKFATFTALTRGGKVPRWKCLSPWRLWIRHLFPIGVILGGFGLLVLLIALFSQAANQHGTSHVSCGATLYRAAACDHAGRR
jgi:hypothetical protein